MNILLLSPSLKPRITGISFRYYNILKYLSIDNNIYLCGYDKNFHNNIPNKNIKCYYLPNISLPSDHYQRVFNIFLFIPSLFYCFYIIKKNKIDILHIAGPDMSNIMWVILKYLTKTKLIYAYHTDITSYLKNRNIIYNNFIIRNLIKYNDMTIIYNCDLFYVMSNSIKYKLNTYYNLTKVNTKVMHFGIDREIFYKNNNNSLQHLWNKNKLKLLIVSRISKEKYINFVINIVKKLNVSLLIIGEGPEEENIKRICLNLNNVNFIGPINHNNLSNYYSEADLFIQPTDNETLGWTMYESLSCGTPVITCKNCYDIIEDGYNGFLYEFNNNVELENLLSDKIINFDKNIYENNCLKSVNNYNWENAVNNINENYNSII